MKVALVTDTHFGVRNDSKTFARQAERFFEKQFFPYLDEHGIDTVIHAGDLVDRRKYISYLTLQSMKRCFVDPCVERGVDLHVIVGNHDVTYRNTNELNACDELLSDIPGVHVYTEPRTVKIGDIPLLFLPWVHRNNHDQTVKEVKKSKADIMVGHLEFSGFEMYRGVVSRTSNFDPKLLKNFDTVLSGHFHHRSSGGNITYLGSPYEMNWADYNDSRGFHVLDLSTREMEFVQNPDRMFYRVNYDDTEKTVEGMEKDLEEFEDRCVKVIVKNRSSEASFDHFMETLSSVGPASISVIEPGSYQREESEEEEPGEVEDTVTILNRYVEEMSTEVDRSQLQSLLNELYAEAQSVTR